MVHLNIGLVKVNQVMQKRYGAKKREGAVY